MCAAGHSTKKGCGLGAFGIPLVGVVSKLVSEYVLVAGVLGISVVCYRNSFLVMTLLRFEGFMELRTVESFCFSSLGSVVIICQQFSHSSLNLCLGTFCTVLISEFFVYCLVIGVGNLGVFIFSVLLSPALGSLQNKQLS